MKNKKGFTLVEIIAVIALIAVIVGIFIVNLVGKNDPKENNKDTVRNNFLVELYNFIDSIYKKKQRNIFL